MRFARQHVQPDAFDARRGAGEIFLDQVLVQPDGFEDLRAAIALQRGDPHLREGLQQAFVDGLDVVLERLRTRLPAALAMSPAFRCARYGLTALAP